ncbi:hypothetical protein Vafri_9456, partial [Volvox africanus]
NPLPTAGECCCLSCEKPHCEPDQQQTRSAAVGDNTGSGSGLTTFPSGPAPPAPPRTASDNSLLSYMPVPQPCGGSAVQKLIVQLQGGGNGYNQFPPETPVSRLPQLLPAQSPGGGGGGGSGTAAMAQHDSFKSLDSSNDQLNINGHPATLRPPCGGDGLLQSYHSAPLAPGMYSSCGGARVDAAVGARVDATTTENAVQPGRLGPPDVIRVPDETAPGGTDGGGGGGGDNASCFARMGYGSTYIDGGTVRRALSQSDGGMAREWDTRPVGGYDDSKDYFRAHHLQQSPSNWPAAGVVEADPFAAAWPLPLPLPLPWRSISDVGQQGGLAAAIADSFTPGGDGSASGVAVTDDTKMEAQMTHTQPFLPAAAPDSSGGGGGGDGCSVTEASWPDWVSGEMYGVNMSAVCSTLPSFYYDYGGITTMGLMGLGGAGGYVPAAAMGSLESSSLPPLLLRPREESIAAAEAWLAQQEVLLAEMERYNRTDPESIGLMADALVGDGVGGGGG